MRKQQQLLGVPITPVLTSGCVPLLVGGAAGWLVTKDTETHHSVCENTTDGKLYCTEER